MVGISQHIKGGFPFKTPGILKGSALKNPEMVGPPAPSLGSRGSAPGLGSGDLRSPESNFLLPPL